jgi:hypothetical protein
MRSARVPPFLPGEYGAMGLRERVQQAISSPVSEAEKLLAEAQHADAHERLSILVSGWFRGIAAALEEVALDVDALRSAGAAGAGSAPPPLPQEGQATAAASSGAPRFEEEPSEPKPEPGERADEAADEAALAERARASRAETEAVREERRAQTDDGDGDER